MVIHTPNHTPRLTIPLQEALGDALSSFDAIKLPTHLLVYGFNTATVTQHFLSSPLIAAYHVINSTHFTAEAHAVKSGIKVKYRRGDIEQYIEYYKDRTIPPPMLTIAYIQSEDELRYLDTLHTLGTRYSIAILPSTTPTCDLPYHTAFVRIPNLIQRYKENISAYKLKQIVEGDSTLTGESAIIAIRTPHNNVTQTEYPTLAELVKHIKGQPQVTHIPDYKDTELPNLGYLPIANTAINPITIKSNAKTKVEGLTEAFIRYDNDMLTAFNSIEGRDIGLIAAHTSRPTLLSSDIEVLTNTVETYGYTVELTAQDRKRLDVKRAYFSREILPLQPITNTELLAYYAPGYITATTTLSNPLTGKPVWIKGINYSLNPSWTRTELYPEAEPVVNGDGKVIGKEDYTIKYSILQLNVTTEGGSIAIQENVCRDSYDDEQTEKEAEAKANGEDYKHPEWKPLLDEFLQVFELPKIALAKEVLKTQYATNVGILSKRYPFLKGYQIDAAANNALKSGGILGSDMGAGKTLQALSILILKQKKLNLIIAPPGLVANWIKEGNKVGLNIRKLLTHDAVTKLQTHAANLKRLTPQEKSKRYYEEQEVYITTPEFLGLGGTGNKLYTPWNATYSVDSDTATIKAKYGTIVPRGNYIERITLTTNRSTSQQEAEELKIKQGQSHLYAHHVKNCPQCGATHDSGFSFNGYCSAKVWDINRQAHKTCNYTAYHYTAKETIKTEEREATLKILTYTGKEKLDNGKTEKKYKEVTKLQLPITETGLKDKSNHAYPAYKRLGKLFGLKIIDECHLVGNLHSFKGQSVAAVNTDYTYSLSGTLSRGYVNDIETALSNSFSSDSPVFPFKIWDNTAFREQFTTTKQKQTTIFGELKKGTGSTIIVPEASNVNRLRKMLNSGLTIAPEHLIEAEWSLPELQRVYREVTLTEETQKKYYEILTSVSKWAKTATAAEISRGAMSRLWDLRALCDGPEKLSVIEEYIKLWAREGHKFIIVAPTIQLYRQIRAIMDSYGIHHIAVDEHTPADKREEVTMKFADSKYRAVISRTKLICTGLNTLVHATRLCIAGGEYQHTTIRQMEKRIRRPGQKHHDIQVVYPIVRLSPKLSVEEEMLRLVLKKEAAVNEIVKGTNRWAGPAMLIESAMAKQGAAQVLSALLSSETVTDISLASLFTIPQANTNQNKHALREEELIQTESLLDLNSETTNLDF